MADEQQPVEVLDKSKLIKDIRANIGVINNFIKSEIAKNEKGDVNGVAVELLRIKQQYYHTLTFLVE